MQLTPPDLILVSLAGSSNEVLGTVSRIRELSDAEEIPIVFWVEDIDEGEEVAMGDSVYLMRPDNFNQLRGLLARVLDQQNKEFHIADGFAAD